MRKVFTLVLLLFVLGSVCAQHISKNNIGFQTNVLSLARAHPAINFGIVTVNDNGKLVDFGLDVGVALFQGNDFNDPDFPLNGHNNRIGLLPSLDFQVGITHFFNEKKGSYYGYRASAGWFPFSHQYSLCTESRFNGSICVCENIEQRTFNSQTIRAGGAIRLGYLAAFNENHYLDFAFDCGLFAHYRLQDLDIPEHARCSLDAPIREEPFSGFDGLVTFGLLDFSSIVYPYFRFTLAYRFM